MISIVVVSAPVSASPVEFFSFGCLSVIYTVVLHMTEL